MPYMNKVFLALILLSQIAAAAEFECKSGVVVVAVYPQPDFDQFTIKGEISKNFELKNVGIYFNNFPLREAFFERLQPTVSETVNYHLFDGQDYQYDLSFPQQFKKSFKARVVLSQQGYIGTEDLDCATNLD